MKNWIFKKDNKINTFDFEGFKKLLNEKNKFSLINNHQIVAMTTTGCAKYSNILEKSNFETIIVEEAAEVFESRILSLLTKKQKN